MTTKKNEEEEEQRDVEADYEHKTTSARPLHVK